MLQKNSCIIFYDLNFKIIIEDWRSDAQKLWYDDNKIESKQNPSRVLTQSLALVKTLPKGIFPCFQDEPVNFMLHENVAIWWQEGG